MKVYTIGLIVYAALLIILATWGMGLIKGTCKNDKVRSYLRLMLVLASVSVTALVCYLTCKTFCYEEDETLHWGVSAIALVMGIGTVIASIPILQNIDKCEVHSSVKLFKDMVGFVAIPASIAAIAFGGYDVVMRLKKWSKKKSKADKANLDKRRGARRERASKREEQELVRIADQAQERIKARQQQKRQSDIRYHKRVLRSRQSSDKDKVTSGKKLKELQSPNWKPPSQQRRPQFGGFGGFGGQDDDDE